MTPPRMKKPESPSVYELCLAYSRGALRRHELISSLNKDELTELGRESLDRALADKLIDRDTYSAVLRPLDW